MAYGDITVLGSAKAWAQGTSAATITRWQVGGTLSAGDVLVAFITNGAGNAVGTDAKVPLPSGPGWTSHAVYRSGAQNSTDDIGVRVVSHVMDGSEPETLVTVAGTDAVSNIHVHLFALSPASVVETVTANNNNGFSAPDTYVDAPALTAAAALALRGWAMQINGGNVTWEITPDDATTVVSISSAETAAVYPSRADAVAPADVVARGQVLSLGSPLDDPALVVSVGLQFANAAPYAPTVVVADTIDSGATNRFTVPFSDPNDGDTQSQVDLRYWLLDGTGARVGAATTVTKASPNQWWDAPAGTFADGDYEIQGQSYDALGVPSGWGPSSFFTADTPTGSPTITDPTSGGTVASDPYTVAWSTAGGQDAYQIRVVADNAGTPDETTVYYDTGQVDDPTSRSAPVPFPDNDVYRHIQVRVYLDGLWSSWGSIRVLVSYTRPPTPTVTPGADDSAGAVVLTYETPAPAAGEPTVSYADIEVRDTSGRDRYRPAAGVRIGTLLTPSGTFIDWLSAAGVNYEYRVIAVGDNGTTSASEWTPISTEASVYYATY